MVQSRQTQPAEVNPTQRRRLTASVAVALLAAVASLTAAVSCEPVTGNGGLAHSVRVWTP